MNHGENTSQPVPTGWLDAMDESDAELAAGLTVPLQPLLDALRQAAEQLDAEPAVPPEHAPARRP
jgi:hypothetical protein